MHDSLIIIPAFNEEASIEKVLGDLLNADIHADILVINDGSTDNTKMKIKSYNVMTINHPINLGYGAAVQTGFRFAKNHGYSYVLQFDADDQHNPKDLQVILNELIENKTDVVIGSRFLGDSDFHPGFLKNAVITFFNFLILFTTKRKITDPTSGLRGLSTKAFQFFAHKNRFPSDYPDADIIIQMLLFRFTVKEVPIQSRKRSFGTSQYTGIEPFIYVIKMSLSILSVILNYIIFRPVVGDNYE